MIFKFYNDFEYMKNRAKNLLPSYDPKNKFGRIFLHKVYYVHVAGVLSREIYAIN